MNMQDINHCEIKLRIQSFDFDAYCQNMSKTEVSSLVSRRSSSAKNIASETEEDKCESSQKCRRVENNSESEDPPESKQVVTFK
ncbi:unnamed protein product, partial [Brassica napus]